MKIDALNNMTFQAARTAGMSRDFDQLLKSHTPAPGSAPGNTLGNVSETSGGEPAREAAEQLVARTLVLPLLQQMRHSPFGKSFLHGGLAEDTFGSQLDTLLADRIVSKANFPIVETIYQKMTAHRGTGVDIDA